MLRATRQPKYYIVPVVERTLDIVELLKETSKPMKVAAISDATGIAHSTAYRILRTLVTRGYVCQYRSGYGYALDTPRVSYAPKHRLEATPLETPQVAAHEVFAP